MKPPWPNPRSERSGLTSISFYLPRADEEAVEVYDVKGRLFKRRAPEVFASSGEHVLQWDVGALASGVYCVRLVTGMGLTAHRKLTVVR